MKLLISNEALRMHLSEFDLEPSGCAHCGAIAGACDDYPNCLGGNMTTKVTIDAHAGWPVQVTAIDTAQDGTVTESVIATVPANEKQDHYCHQTRELRIKELPPLAT